MESAIMTLKSTNSDCYRAPKALVIMTTSDIKLIRSRVGRSDLLQPFSVHVASSLPGVRGNKGPSSRGAVVVDHVYLVHMAWYSKRDDLKGETGGLATRKLSSSSSCSLTCTCNEVSTLFWNKADPGAVHCLLYQKVTQRALIQSCNIPYNILVVESTRAGLDRDRASTGIQFKHFDIECGRGLRAWYDTSAQCAHISRLEQYGDLGMTAIMLKTANSVA